jgi:hypothetical protein
VRPSLRGVLAESHIAAITIAALLLGAFDSAFRALWGPLVRITEFIVTAIAVRDIPYFDGPLLGVQLLMVDGFLFYFLWAVIGFSAAWLLSRWVFGVGPLRSLGNYRSKLTRRDHA